MPSGLSVCRWDDKVGLRIVGVYPRNLGVSEDDMLRVFTAHAMGKPEAGFLTMTLEGTNLAVASFYTGIMRGRDQFCIMLFMALDEEPRSYEEGLTLASSEIVENIGEPEFVEYLGEVFEKLKRMVELSVEQRLAKVFVDQETRLLMHKLARGGIPAEELREWLELQTGKHYPDLGLVTLPLLRSGLVEEDWINAVSDNCVFLVNDLLGARFPPEQTLKLAKSGGLNKEQYNELEGRVKSYFESYEWSEDDTVMIGQLLLDPDIYDVTKALRRKIAHKSELVGVVEKEASLDNVIRRLEQAQVITKFGENTVEVAANDDPLIVMQSDVHFESFFPEFLVLRLQERLTAKDIHPDIAKRHLELLSETYMRMREKMKERKKRKAEEEELPVVEAEMVVEPEEFAEPVETPPLDEEEAKRIAKEEEKARKAEEKRLKEEEKKRKKEQEAQRKAEDKTKKEEEEKRKAEEKAKKEEEKARKAEEKAKKDEEKRKKKEEEEKTKQAKKE
ncbi:MAG: hypothetical protein Q6361_04770 [Candidatus Hermodarchaeota archaeon]|nr:hypothetical protein [Candidatus Hermodarchaeota archaeon]